MAVVELKDIIDRLEILNTDEHKDLYVSLLEDITDSFGDGGEEISALRKQIEDLEAKVKEVDDSWKEKYIQRFKEGNKEEVKGETKEEGKEEGKKNSEEKKSELSMEELVEEWKNE